MKRHNKVSRNAAYAVCVDCKTRRIVLLKEWDRASQPRCYACGGRLEQCSPRSKSAQIVQENRDCALSRRDIYED